MDASALSNISQPALWTDSPEGYFLMFVAMAVGGPAVTSAGAFAAAFGVFNIWIVFLVSIASNLFPDALYYAIGFWGREQLIERLIKKYGKYIKVTKEEMLHLEKLYENHVGKTLTFVKLVPFLATPGLVAAGVVRVPLKRYIFWSIVVTLPTSLVFLIIGYYFGAAYERIAHYTEYGGIFAAALFVIFITISYFYRKFTKKIEGKIDEL